VIAGPNPLAAAYEVSSSTPSSCPGDPGFIRIKNISGGSGQYEFSVSTTPHIPGAWQTDSLLNNLAPYINYYVFMRDMNSHACVLELNGGGFINFVSKTPVVINSPCYQHQSL